MQQMSMGENTKKGILDFLVAAVAALNYIHFNSTYVELATIGVKILYSTSVVLYSYDHSCMGSDQCNKLL